MVALAAAVAIACTLCISACGQAEPDSAVTKAQFERALEGSPPPLAKLYSRGGQIVDGGTDAYKAQLASLKGYPVVVNKWASWCGPCRYEFPFFQRQSKRQGKRIAFLAVDGEDARGDAKKFLSEFPVPYPSYFDPDNEIAKTFRGNRAFPTTAFYDSKGELAFTKQGGYPSEAALEKDLRQYAR